MIRILLTTFFIFSFTYIDAQLLDLEWFNLKGNIKSCSVICYDYNYIDGVLEEGFPYSENISYQTDLNLVYLEFNQEGMISKSKLYYPRDFYNPFDTIYPVQDLEKSDFMVIGNFLTKFYSYRYSKEDGVQKLEILDSRGRKINTSYRDGLLIEDELYIYEEHSNEDKTVLSKRNKGSVYNYRRLETETIGNKTVVKEFLNNRFLQSKSITIVGSEFIDNISITKSRINASREFYNSDGLLEQRQSYNMNWRNRVTNWPEIDFDENLDYISFLTSLKRVGSETKELFTYGNGKLIQNTINDNTYRYLYDDKGRLETVYYNNQYRDYVYDDNGNWLVKIVGVMNSDNQVRIPKKKYQRTLTYF